MLALSRSDFISSYSLTVSLSFSLSLSFSFFLAAALLFSMCPTFSSHSVRCVSLSSYLSFIRKCTSCEEIFRFSKLRLPLKKKLRFVDKVIYENFFQAIIKSLFGITPHSKITFHMIGENNNHLCGYQNRFLIIIKPHLWDSASLRAASLRANNDILRTILK